MSLFKPVKNSISMPEAIVKQIEKKILLGKLKPDSILPSENQLMKQFNVSRNTVREALKMLKASGIIKIKRGSQGGPTVTRLSNEFISEFLIKAIRLGGFSGDSIAQFRLALEPSVAEMLATIDIDPELILKMEKNIKEVKKLKKANKFTGYRNMDFHVLLALATGNPMFIIILKTLRVIFHTITPGFVRNRMQSNTIEYHQKILNAIKKRDPIGARNQMAEHLAQLSEIMKDANIKEIRRTKS